MELLNLAMEQGRVVISAEAGSGKTWLLARTMRAAVRQETVVPVWISIRTLSSLDRPISGTNVGAVMNGLLIAASSDLRSILTYSGKAPKVLLLADGLNEMARDGAEAILEALDEIAGRFPFISVIVTDRLVRRPVSLNRWKLLTVLPLSQVEVTRIWNEAGETHELPRDLSILRRPFFLDSALSVDFPSANGAEAIAAYLDQRVGLDATVLNRLGDVAFASYRKYRGRSFNAEWFRNEVSQEVITTLLEAGAVRERSGQMWYSHHLLHDFLAARYLKNTSNMWGPTAFGVVTLNAASFDALRLMVEQIPEEQRCDELIRSIYDWNYFGAAYALSGHVRDETRWTILAMLADKRWDPIAATVATVTDALRIDNSGIGQRLLSLQDRQELFSIVQAIPSTDNEFNRWRQVFTLPDGVTADLSLAEGLRQDDSVIGWTLANVLRRSALTSEAIRFVIETSLSGGTPVERWRAVHVLGAHGTAQASDALIEAMQDDDQWVRYGAIRSLVEVAAASEEVSLRDQLVRVLIEFVQQGMLDVRMQGELAKALDIRPQPPNWAPAVAPLIQQLIGAASDPISQRKWTRVMEAIVVTP
ncbi:NACHT domain-containing protein [Actinomadura madurae]|uniref:NACHT domain-containing protein n=2 Tax=Actinomadura madurae TaxID=1993 RepID=UPI0020D1F681|nr:HEAT repeat domain-containing protein [Actinomadura madurae]MCP9965836.1 HEAT repeat domain-containing protein [Actinomadura madurae]MCP9978315.1 HEAT repeat domain-containing protein [Actinomadura madurae]